MYLAEREARSAEGLRLCMMAGKSDRDSGIDVVQLTVALPSGVSIGANVAQGRTKALVDAAWRVEMVQASRHATADM